MARAHKDTTLTASYVAARPDDGQAKRPAVPSRSDKALTYESRISSKGQITLPKSVRAVLGVAEGDRILFRARNGRVEVEAMPDGEPDDPAVTAFLALLERDLATRAAAAGDFPEPLMAAIKALTAGITFDIDDPIDGDVAI